MWSLQRKIMYILQYLLRMKKILYQQMDFFDPKWKMKYVIFFFYKEFAKNELVFKINIKTNKRKYPFVSFLINKKESNEDDRKILFSIIQYANDLFLEHLVHLFEYIICQRI